MPENAAVLAGKPIVQRIHEFYPKLPEGERKVADVLLAAPADSASGAVLDSSFVGLLCGACADFGDFGLDSCDFGDSGDFGSSLVMVLVISGRFWWRFWRFW